MILIYSHHVPIRKMCRQYTALYLDSFIIFSFSSAIHKMLYGGANFVPIAVLCFYLSAFFRILTVILKW